MSEYEKELKEIYEKSEKTELDRKLYEFHLNFLRELDENSKKKMEEIEKEHALPVRYVTVYDSEGNEVSGEIKNIAQKIYTQMFNAKEMITKTEGEERKAWIKKRSFWNGKLIEFQDQFPGYRFIPSSSK